MKKYEVTFVIVNPQDFEEFPRVKSPVYGTSEEDAIRKAQAQIMQDIDVWFDLESDPGLAGRMKEAARTAEWYAYEKV